MFPAPPPPEHDVVVFRHALKSEGLALPAGVPVMDNHAGTMEQAIAFPASGETVVTNSYHGTYWAMCLGRRVICVPFNRKFTHFRMMPVVAKAGAWPAQLARAERRDEMLEEARERNRAFLDKVQALL